MSLRLLWCAISGFSRFTINKGFCVTTAAEISAFAIQNGSVSIRKWRKQLGRISWIKFPIPVHLTPLFVKFHPVHPEFGLRVSNTSMVSVIQCYVTKPSDTSAVTFYKMRYRQPLLGAHVLYHGIRRFMSYYPVVSYETMCTCRISYIEIKESQDSLLTGNKNRNTHKTTGRLTNIFNVILSTM